MDDRKRSRWMPAFDTPLWRDYLLWVVVAGAVLATVVWVLVRDESSGGLLPIIASIVFGTFVLSVVLGSVRQFWRGYRSRD